MEDSRVINEPFFRYTYTNSGLREYMKPYYGFVSNVYLVVLIVELTSIVYQNFQRDDHTGDVYSVSRMT